MYMYYYNVYYVCMHVRNNIISITCRLFCTCTCSFIHVITSNTLILYILIIIALVPGPPLLHVHVYMYVCFHCMGLGGNRRTEKARVDSMILGIDVG